jgi:hypothetical protein
MVSQTAAVRRRDASRTCRIFRRFDPEQRRYTESGRGRYFEGRHNISDRRCRISTRSVSRRFRVTGERRPMAATGPQGPDGVVRKQSPLEAIHDTRMHPAKHRIRDAQS